MDETKLTIQDVVNGTPTGKVAVQRAMESSSKDQEIMQEKAAEIKAVEGDDKLDDKLRVIHNRFHGRYDTHAQVAKLSPWTSQELENVQIEDEWLMYQEIKQLFTAERQHQQTEMKQRENETEWILKHLRTQLEDNLVHPNDRDVALHAIDALLAYRQGDSK